MRLWTFQPQEVLEGIQTGRLFHCDESKSELIQEFQFGKPYDFMAKSMEKRLTASERPDGVLYPVWAWHTAYGAHRRPDRRFRMFNNYGENALIEIEVPDERVLLSDYDDWHCVLNDYPILPESFYEDESDGRDPYDLAEAMSHEEVERTWNHIFDVQGKDFVQACFWELLPEDFVKCW